MDFKTRFQGRTTTMDKQGVIGIVAKTSQPITKVSESQVIIPANISHQSPQPYYFQKFQRNAQRVLQSDTETDQTPSTRSDFPSRKFALDRQQIYQRQDLEKLNMDEYQIFVIPKKAFEGQQYSMTHSFVPVFSKRNVEKQTEQIQQLKTFSDRQLNYGSALQQKNKSPFIQAGYGALKDKQLYLKGLKR